MGLHSLRVKTSSGKLYWRGMGVDTLAESNLSGSMTDEFVYFAGRKVARRLSTGDVHYYFADHLGSTRVLTSTGSYVEDLDFYPFGGLRSYYSSGSKYKFTGYERDSESNLDYAIFRHYGSTLGRFYQPDPLAGSVANPQSLNRYAYVLNDPSNLVDPLGLEWTCTDVTIDGTPTGQKNCVWHDDIPTDGPIAEGVENDAIGNGPGSAWCPVGIGLGMFLVPCGGRPAPQQPREPEKPKKPVPYDKACPGSSAVASFSLGGNILAGANVNITLGINSTGLTLSTRAAVLGNGISNGNRRWVNPVRFTFWASTSECGALVATATLNVEVTPHN
ncbi:MAG TPA: RHS repeat-associated core domain-containing protein [Terriglobales bacterium]|nr:RHS repeat-associated core domain-containing protein [Terriglobales bacterium]